MNKKTAEISQSDRMQRKLKKEHVTIEITGNNYTLKNVEPRALVISGAGAKGLTYVGMLQALSDCNKIQNLTHVSGASAGSIMSSLIATGVGIDDILKFTQKLDIKQLLDRDRLAIRAKGERVRNVFELIYMLQVKKHLEQIHVSSDSEEFKKYNELNKKINFLQTALHRVNININSMDDILKITESPEKLKELDKAFRGMPDKISVNDSEISPRILFSDLKALRELLPKDKKHLIKNLSMVVTNQTKNQLERYGEDNDPNQSISQIVQWSSAHPALFTPGKKINEKGEIEYIADGGILNNMPPAIGEGINEENTLAVKPETGAYFNERIKVGEQHALESRSTYEMALDQVYFKLIGAEYNQTIKNDRNREKVYYYYDNMVYLNSGGITTTNMNPTEEMVKTALENGKAQTLEVLNKQQKTFEHPLMAIIYAGPDILQQKMRDNPNNELEEKLFKAAAHAQILFNLQNALVDDINNNDFRFVQRYLEQIHDLIENDSGMTNKDQNDLYSLCLKQVNFKCDNKLYDYLEKVIAAEKPDWAQKAKDFLLRVIVSILPEPIVKLINKPNENTATNTLNSTVSKNTTQFYQKQLNAMREEARKEIKDEIKNQHGDVVQLI